MSGVDKRMSNGFKICSEVCAADMLDDEPYQIASKFPEIMVAVDADRINGISQLMRLDEAPDVIILDDAYQHRYVKPGLNILLTDYNRLLYKDFMLPAGRLREPSSGKRRADVIVVTKTPETIKSEEIREISEAINPNVDKSLFFSGFTSKNLINVCNCKKLTFYK